MEKMEMSPASPGVEEFRPTDARNVSPLGAVANEHFAQSSCSWIDVDLFSNIANITPQGARKILRNAQSGLPWRNHILKVCQVHCAGAAAGKSWRVQVDSLPHDLRDKIEAQRLDTFRVARNQKQRIEPRLTAIEPILSVESKTEEWQKLLCLAAAVNGVTPETVKDWLHRLAVAEGDINALGWKRPSNAGQRRVHVSRKFDKAFLAAGYCATDLAPLSDHADNLAKAAWASSAQRAGWRSIFRR